MKNIIVWYSRLNIYYKLLPFLFLYLIIIIFFSRIGIGDGDEDRYLWFANNLINGFYSPPAPNFDVWNGPGYPFLIAPFMFLKFSLLALRILNGLLLYFSLIISYKTFSIFSSKRSAFVFTVLLGLYFPIFEMLLLIVPECLTWFLISLIGYLLIKTYQQKNTSWKHIILTSLSIALLAMTKVIFGYVIALMILASILIFFIPSLRSSAKKSVFIFLFSLIFCLPWLTYTYSLTNKLFYWTNSGNMSLYTMSTPHENELGDWFDSDYLQQNPNHKVFMDSILSLNPLQRDQAYKEAAIVNIKSNPKKYFSNWMANVGRLLFSYPHSKEQTIQTYYTLIPNMFVVVFIFIALVISIVYYKKLPEALIILFLFIIIYLAGSTIVSAYRRMFYVTMPFWFFFISYVYNNLISIKIKQH